MRVLARELDRSMGGNEVTERLERARRDAARRTPDTEEGRSLTGRIFAGLWPGQPRHPRLAEGRARLNSTAIRETTGRRAKRRP